jgi:HEAT repeat protein
MARSEEPAKQRRAAVALGQFGHKAIPTLTELIKRGNPDSVEQATLALATIGPDSVPALIAVLNDGYFIEIPFVRRDAALALGQIGPAAKAAVPRLTEMLEVFSVESAAATALGQIGPAAKASVPALTKQLNHRDKEVREAARQALVQIGS